MLDNFITIFVMFVLILALPALMFEPEESRNKVFWLLLLYSAVAAGIVLFTLGVLS